MSVTEYERALSQFVGTPLVDLAGERLNPGDYQAARRVAHALLVDAVGHSDRARWRTVPVDPGRGATREPTALLARLDFDEVRETPFSESELAGLVSERLLLLPVIKPDVSSPDDWWYSEPHVIEFTPEHLLQFERDYEEIRDMVRTGRAGQLSSGAAGPGRFLITKPNGSPTTVVLGYHDDAGRRHEASKRGFYLRGGFVAGLLADVASDPEVAVERARRARTPNDVLEAVKVLTATDDKVLALRRREQGYARRILFGDDPAASCDLCRRFLPTDLLVAAHIKPRAQCTLEERLDLPNVLMSACCFGCDELYERGYISVAAGRVLVTNELPTRALIEQFAHLQGQIVGAAWPRGERYFAWHREHVFRST